jgi:UDP-3-O-[3-hydroxymyristoyl] glucosamine N-acyltransferase
MQNRFFKNCSPFTLGFLIEHSGLSAYGENINYDILINDVKPLDQATDGDLTFFSNSKYINDFKSSKASVCITHPKFKEHAPHGVILLLSENPYASYATLLKKFYPDSLPGASIAQTAQIASSAKISSNCFIGNFVVIGEDVEIGEGCIIEPFTYICNGVKIGARCKIESHVRIANAIIGDDCIILTGAKIGQDGFGFATDNGQHIKIQHIGSVLIGNDVEIGACTTIDRGSLGNTVISDGCRIDNLVQIGHNVRLGICCVVVAQVGIAGSTEIGDYCFIGGQVGIAGHLRIAAQTTMIAKSGISNNIKESGQYYAGYPAIPAQQWRKQTVLLRRMAKKDAD